jgi:hypothetical protein
VSYIWLLLLCIRFIIFSYTLRVNNTSLSFYQCSVQGRPLSCKYNGGIYTGIVWGRNAQKALSADEDKRTDDIRITFRMKDLRPSSGRFLAWIVGSNPVGDFDVYLLIVVLWQVDYLRWPDPSFWGVLHSVCVCVSVIKCDHVQK